MRRHVLAALSAILLFALPLGAQDWETIGSEGGVTVSRKAMPDSDIVAFKGDTIIDAPIGKVLWVLTDNEHRTEWVDLLMESRILEKSADWEYVVYQSFDVPMPLSDRDYVYRGRMFRRAGSQDVLLEIASTEHADAPQTVGVRAHLHRSAYVVTPLDDGARTRVQVEIFTDPKGWIPAWLVNLVQASWPAKTLNGIRKQVQQDYVGLCPLPPLEGPAAD